MSLPEVVVFSVRDSTNEVRYLSFTGPQRQLRFGPEEEVFSDTARFAVESAGGGLVHIRSCFENHYWARASRFEQWLTASAPEKEEDMSKDGCTLFRPRMSGGNVSVRFAHAQSGMNVVMLPADNAHGYNLRLEFSAATDFSFIDFGVLSSTKLPRYVMFHTNDFREYLSVVKETENSGYVRYRFWGNMNREGGFEVLYSKHGDLRIKSMALNEFWSASSNADKRVVIRPLPEFHTSTLFDATELLIPPVNFNGTGIAIRSLVYNEYCQRSDAGGSGVVIQGKTPNDVRAWLRPLYLGIPDNHGRGVVNIESFRHAWRSEPEFVRNSRYEPFRNREPHEVEIIVPIGYSHWMERAFTNSTPIIKRAGVVFNGRIPEADSTGEVVIPDGATDNLEFWNHPRVLILNKTHHIKIIAPPNSSGTAIFSLQKATYEVPFSYQQIDVFPFGGTETQHLHDGVYKMEVEYGFTVSYTDIQPLSSEVLNDDRYTDIRVLERQGINLIDDHIQPNASHEGINAIDGGIEPNASHEGINAIDGGIEPNASHERINAIDDGNEPNASHEIINAVDDGIEPNASHEGINAIDGGIEPNASHEGINAIDGGIEPNASNEIINALDDGIEPNASHEGINAIDGGIEPNASHEGINAIDGGIEPNASNEIINALDDGIEPNASHEGINAIDDGIEPNTSHEGINVQDNGIKLNASDEVNQE